MNTLLNRALTLGLLLLHLDARAVEFEKLGTAIAKGLATKEAFKTSVTTDAGSVTVYYSKGPDQKPKRYAIVEEGLYEPNCTHKWVVALNHNAKVLAVLPVEMACPHAFPAKASSFLEQYRGKGPADVTKLPQSIKTVAKATASCELTTKAVIRSIQAAQKAKQNF